VALSNNRLLCIEDGQVTFRYQDGTSGQTKTCTLPAEALITRFLQHILPKSFVKVRYYGLFRIGHRQHLARLRAQLILQQRKADLLSPPDISTAPAPALAPICPTCGHEMRLERILPAQRAPPAG
jgi:putative transposase